MDCNTELIVRQENHSNEYNRHLCKELPIDVGAIQGDVTNLLSGNYVRKCESEKNDIHIHDSRKHHHYRKAVVTLHLLKTHKMQT